MAKLDGKEIDADELDCAKQTIAIFVGSVAVGMIVDVRDAAEKAKSAIRALRMVTKEE